MAPDPRRSEVTVAHVLRRVTVAPRAELVDRWVEAGPDALIDWALDAPALPANPADGIGPEDWQRLVGGWLSQLRSPKAGLHERMTWFWHTHFTTSSDKVNATVPLWRQQKLLRRHAMGNFRELVREVSTDAAMLVYLDGDPSSIETPNENYARELMELFTLGRGNYSQDDVAAGALALAGWSVDSEHGWKVRYTQEDALDTEVTFLGRRGRLGVDEIVDTICDHDACAPFIAAKVHAYLVGVAPDRGRLEQLAKVFRGAKLDIAALVREIVRHPSFRDQALTRPRSPLEWLSAALAAMGNDRRGGRSDDGSRRGMTATDDVDPYWFDSIGQVPYKPPNVAGWPGGPRLLSPSQLMARAGMVSWMSPEPDSLGDADPVAAVLRRCLLFDVSASTRAALEEAAKVEDPDARTSLLYTLATTSPEFGLL